VHKQLVQLENIKNNSKDWKNNWTKGQQYFGK